jgi:serine/threonine protein kinase
MLTGQLPFRGKELAETVSMHLRATALPPSQSNAKIGVAIDQIVLKLMSKSRGDRYPSAQAVAQALSMVTTGS